MSDPTLTQLLVPRAGLRGLVTGGTSGLGLAMVEALESFGVDVFVCGTDPERLARHLAAVPGRRGALCDVSDAAQVDALFDRLESEWGELDFLVNNAGIAGPTSPVESTEVEDWQRTIDINLTGAFLCSRRGIPLLKPTRGAIVNISSVAGRLGYALRASYNASKFGLGGLTDSLAREVGPEGIRVNAVLPGFVDSARLNRTSGARAEALGITTEEVDAILLSKTSLRTKVSEQEVALLVCYLLSPAARAISGQSISIDGNVEYL